MLRWFLLPIAFLCGCRSAPAPSRAVAASASPEALPVAVRASAAPAHPTALPVIDFGAHGLADAGCFALHDIATGEEQLSSTKRCAQPRLPFSTFKMANALIGLDLGLLSGPDAMMKHDFARYPREASWLPGWENDQTLRSAMAVSAVPLFRKLAHDIGKERMAAYLARLDYGNRDVSGGDDHFWLDGGLRITALEQLAFVRKLVRDELPVAKKAQADLREALKRDAIADMPNAGKTGTGKLAAEQSGRAVEGVMLAWMVGWLELPRGPVTYAMWIEAASFDEAKALRIRTLEAVFGEVAAKWK